MWNRSDPAAFARQLESELDDYPEDRAEILIEASGEWHRAGEHDRAIELLTEVIGLGGEDGGVARVSLADVLFDLGRTTDARAQLDALRSERPSSSMPYHMAGELLEERAEFREALTMFNMAIARMSEAELATPNGKLRHISGADVTAAGRRRVRQALGMPPDQLDDAVPEPPSLREFADLEERSELADRGQSPNEVRILFWPRQEIPLAHDRWSELVGHTDADAVMRDRELANRELADAGATRLTMVPLTVARLAEFATRTGRDPLDDSTRHACMEETVADGDVLSWPPPRNAPCWCGSTAKYKKCCGRPNPARSA